MIRNKTMCDIRDKIDSHSKFIITDFQIEHKNSMLIIKYDSETTYFFEIDLPNATSTVTTESKETRMLQTFTNTKSHEDYRFTVRMSPGQISSNETIDFYGEGMLYKNINTWLNCLWDELLSLPIQRQFKEQEKIISEIKENLKDISDAFFTYEEGEELKRKINEFEVKFYEQLTKEITDKEELKAKFNELHSQFENLKSTIYSLKKRGWFTSFATKTFVWFTKEDNRKFLKDAKDSIQQLLPENIKNLLPPSH